MNQVVTSLHEPLFIHHGYQLTEDMMQEMYATLVKKNNDSKMDAKGNWKYPSHSKIVGKINNKKRRRKASYHLSG